MVVRLEALSAGRALLPRKLFWYSFVLHLKGRPTSRVQDTKRKHATRITHAPARGPGSLHRRLNVPTGRPFRLFRLTPLSLPIIMSSSSSVWWVGGTNHEVSRYALCNCQQPSSTSLRVRRAGQTEQAYVTRGTSGITYRSAAADYSEFRSRNRDVSLPPSAEGSAKIRKAFPNCFLYVIIHEADSYSSCQRLSFLGCSQHCTGPLLCSSGQSSWLLTQRSRVRFPAIPDFLSSSGSGTVSTRPL
jgi:hypothetical protein